MEGVIRLVREKVLWLQVRVGLSGSRKLLEEARGRDAGGCSYGSLGPCSHTVNMFQGPSPGLTPSPQGRTHPSFPSCSLEICHFQGRRWQPADFLLGLPGSCLLVLFQNGEVECSFTPCPELDCPREEWWLGPGQCCYACREPVPMTGEGHPACIPGRTQLQAGKQRGVRLSFVH